MKIPARIGVPILAAVILGGGLIGFLWWQLALSSAHIRAQLLQGAIVPDTPTSATLSVSDPIASGDMALLHLRRGDLLALQGEWSEAETEYQAAVGAGGGVPALRKLAQAQLQRRKIEDVRGTIAQLRRAGAKNEDLLLLEVLVALRTNDQEHARQLLAKAPASPQKHYGLALLAIAEGQHDTVKTELQTIMTGWDPILRAYARVLQGAYDEYGTFPGSPALHRDTLLARALAQVQECELALPLLQKALAENSDYRDAWIVQGYCQLTSERFDEALASLERAYALDPEKPEIQYFLGRAHLALGNAKDAATYFGYALQNGFEPVPEVRKQLAKSYLALHDTFRALEQYRALADAANATMDDTSLAISALMAAGDKESAYQYAAAAAGKWPSDARAQEYLGWVAMESGRKDEAITALMTALKLDPTRESAREKLKKLQ